MTTVEEVERAKSDLKRRIGRPSWLRGIGIGFADDGSYRLQVNVSKQSSEVDRTVPSEVDGVEVHVEVVGDVVARGASR